MSQSVSHQSPRSLPGLWLGLVFQAYQRKSQVKSLNLLEKLVAAVILARIEVMFCSTLVAGSMGLIRNDRIHRRTQNAAHKGSISKEVLDRFRQC